MAHLTDGVKPLKGVVLANPNEDVKPIEGAEQTHPTDGVKLVKGAKQIHLADDVELTKEVEQPSPTPLIEPHLRKSTGEYYPSSRCSDNEHVMLNNSEEPEIYQETKLLDKK